jgi:ferric-dicitrate binding protein FerR (iron transport regulator)
MTSEELSRLLDAYRDNTLTREEAEALVGTIRAGGEASQRILAELRFEGVLSQALEPGDAQAFLRSFQERLAAEREGTAFLRAFERRRSVARTRPASSWGIPLAFAAGILFAVVVWWVSTGSSTSPHRVAEAPVEPEVRPTDRAPVEAPPSSPPALPDRRPAPRNELPPRATANEPPVLPKDSKAEPERPTAPPAPPADVRPSPVPKEPSLETRVGIVTVLSTQGEVFRLDGAARTPLGPGQTVPSGLGIECASRSSASAVFSDGTRVELGADTVLRDIFEKKGKRLALQKGSLVAQVAKQPADAPLVVTTPHGEARVLGTALRLDVDAQTRLEVTEGKVRLTRAGGKSVDVQAGSFASCGPGLEPVARVVHPDDIVLVPQQAKLVGDEWRIAPDRNASTGWMLEVVKTPYKAVDHVDLRPSYALFTFYASAEKEYRLWLRSLSSATGDKWTREMVTLEPGGCTLSVKSSFFGAAPTTAYVFTGLSNYSGYAWSSGSYDEGKPEPPAIVVRFKTTGLQTLKLYTVQPSIHVDAIWLSSRQSSRPAPRFLPPLDGR